MSYGSSIGKAIGVLYMGAIFGIILFFGILIYGTYKTYDYYFNDEVILSEHKITPTFKLKVLDNNKIDTIWVYTNKK